jgi:CHAT domain
VAGNRSRRANASGSVDPAKAKLTSNSGVVAPLGAATRLQVASMQAPPAQAGPVQPAFAQGASNKANAEAKPSTGRTNNEVRITLVRGGLTNVKAPVVIGARYDGLPFIGPTKLFDRALDMWLTRAVDLGIIGSTLGQLFPIDLERFHKAGKLQAKTLLLAGMGEPGRFAQDSLQFIFSNIFVAIKAMGENEFASSLLGTRRNELSIGEAVRGLLHGVADGYDRIKAIAEDVTEDKDGLRATVQAPLSLVLVHSDQDKIDLIEKELAQIKKELETTGNEKLGQVLRLTIGVGDPVETDPELDADPIDVEPDAGINYLRVTRSISTAAGMARHPSNAPGPGKKAAARRTIDPFPTDVFQFSALSEVAVIPQREQEVNTRLLRDLADRMTKSCTPEKCTQQGDFFTNLVIPDDFRALLEGPASVTLEVDDVTAVYPWEMAGYRKISNAFLLGINIAISRQFRTLLSPPPSSPPALNSKLKALIIADPAPGIWSLPGARLEGAAVVEVLQQAQTTWGGQYEVEATVRIGSSEDPADQRAEQILQALRKNTIVKSAALCDPLELVMLLVNDQYDLVHYAGHGMYDRDRGQTGWVFAADCVLSAKDIFRIRQVPRLVFANACFSAVASDHNEQRSHMAGLAQAFFGRGIPNYVGAGWEVDDRCAVECARWFYACLMGLNGPDPHDGIAATSSEATIGKALRKAREKALESNPESSSWGAYQHYGHVSDRLVSIANAPAASAMSETTVSTAISTRDVQSATTSSGATQVTTNGNDAKANASPDDPNLVYVNGIDFNTGKYAFKPRTVADVAAFVAGRPGIETFDKTRGDQPRAFALPFGTTENIEDTGWGIIFPTDTPESVRSALSPLIEFRRKRAGKRLKVFDYSQGEQLRDWYVRQAISPGNPSFNKVPYYLLLIGHPDQIPFEFQYLLGIEYAVGRLAFDNADDYKQYVSSAIDYESAASVPNEKKITYWGTRHPGDGATRLSSSFLLDPLINGIPDDDQAPINKAVSYGQDLFLAKDATKANLLAAIHARRPPALLFTASHGMGFNSGQAEQAAGQGALLCQDWPGFGNVKTEHFLAAADISDDASVIGMVAFLFACFGAGTPDKDQFVRDLSQAAVAPPLAPKPFIAMLPRRLLSHPKGSALAVIGHIDRAWGFSMQDPKVASPKVVPFRSSIGSILSGTPIGHAMCGQFGARYAELSALLLNATSPTAPAAMRLGDLALVNAWIERNDAQNYVLLGDPSVRIRSDIIT